ncbi:S8 family serine peptidase, partial [bacterium]|nr:S8 family serine peptidase [bacterium]
MRTTRWLFLLTLVLATTMVNASTGLPTHFQPSLKTSPDQAKYQSGLVVFKVEPELKVELHEAGASRFGQMDIDRFADDIGAVRFETRFPNARQPKTGGTDLSLIYVMHFPETVSVLDVCRDMAKLPGVQYAEPRFIDYTFLDHNDTYRNVQYGLDLCEANAAHDICTGSDEIIIGIVDTGVKWDHEDLIGNIWTNEDGSHGWDFMDNDDDPTDIDGHGTHVAGIASASTHNELGVASVAYSCQIMAVRTGTGGYIYYGYEGIVYAVDNGAHVINCSWGGPSYSEASQDVINYAYNNGNGALVVVSAGNDGDDGLNYPAAYDNVVAVAATDQNDRKADFSSYGDFVDISAPGVSIASTMFDRVRVRRFYQYVDAYYYMSGTSMASPFAASVAALIWSQNPDATVDQVRYRLLEGADPIEDELMGSGRINALNSLLVNMGNQPPVWTDVPESITEYVNTPITFSVTGTDPEGEDLTITHSGVGSIEHTGNGTAVFTWTTPADFGDYTATFTLSDGDLDLDVDAVVTINVVNQPVPGTMIVSAIGLSENVINRNFSTCEGEVTVIDPEDDAAAVEGALVSATWSGLYNDDVEGTTDGNGQVTFVTANMRRPNGLLTLTITGVTKADWTYDEENSVTTASLGVGTYGAGNGDLTLNPGVPIPEVVMLNPAYPNPFNATVQLNFSLPNDSYYRLQITDLSGREVAALGEGWTTAGRYSRVWDASGLPAGMFIARLDVPGS